MLLERMEISSIPVSVAIVKAIPEAIVLVTLILNIHGGHGNWFSRLVKENVN